jgi:hypothetical protein
LVPEGLIEFIPEVKILIQEINNLLADQEPLPIEDLIPVVESKLSQNSLKVFNFLPKTIKEQLLLDRDPHGNVQVAKIETEKLLITLIEAYIDVPFSP